MAVGLARRARREARRAEGMSWPCANDNHARCAGGRLPEGVYGRPTDDDYQRADRQCSCYCHDGLTAYEYRLSLLEVDT